MLVLTRRENEKIVFPDVGITVELIAIEGNRARLGVHAPKMVRILRHELTTDAPSEIAPLSPEALASHDLSNRLNKVTLAAELVRMQIERGEFDRADSSAQKILAELNELNLNVATKRLPVPRERPRNAARKTRALLVEDDANESELLAGYLRLSGFDVATAGDGYDALDYLKAHERPDVMLLDMLMPRFSGPETVEAVRRNPQLQGMRIFAVSGLSPARFGLSEGGAGGIDRWFHKPLNPQELVREMSRELTC